MEIFSLHINMYLRSHDLQSVSGSRVVGRVRKGSGLLMLEYSLLYSCRITKSLKKLCELVEQLEGASGHFMFHIFINYLDGGAELTLSKFQVLESRQKRLILVGLPDWGRLEKRVLGNLRGFSTGKCPLLCTRTDWGMSGWQGSHPCV